MHYFLNDVAGFGDLSFGEYNVTLTQSIEPIADTMKNVQYI